jgi:hypothetical protein
MSAFGDFMLSNLWLIGVFELMPMIGKLFADKTWILLYGFVSNPKRF